MGYGMSPTYNLLPMTYYLSHYALWSMPTLRLTFPGQSIILLRV